MYSLSDMADVCCANANVLGYFRRFVSERSGQEAKKQKVNQ